MEKAVLLYWDRMSYRMPGHSITTHNSLLLEIISIKYEYEFNYKMGYATDQSLKQYGYSNVSSHTNLFLK